MTTCPDDHESVTPLRLEFYRQAEFPEPPARINANPCDRAALNWKEPQAWDELLRYYSIKPYSD